MPILPNPSMRETAARIIDFLGDTMNFQRKNGGIWGDVTPAVTVHVQPRDSYFRRSFRGMEDGIDFTGYAAAAADIQRGDRTVIDGVYYIVDNLKDRGTHFEFGLKQTDERPDV